MASDRLCSPGAVQSAMKSHPGLPAVWQACSGVCPLTISFYFFFFCAFLMDIVRILLSHMHVLLSNLTWTFARTDDACPWKRREGCGRHLLRFRALEASI